MKYRVIKRFTDLQDGNHLYNEGDTFPREGVTVTEERLVELSTAANRRHIPLIEAVEDGTGTPMEVKAADLPDSGKAVKIVEGHFDEKALSTMKVDDLSKLAADLGVDISKAKVKADYVAALSAVTVTVEDGTGTPAPGIEEQ